MEKYLICYSKHKDNDLQITSRLQEMLNADILNMDYNHSKRDMSKYSIVFVVGGDGTILKTLHYVYPHSIPVVGVNLGRRGYIAQIEPANMENEVKNIINGHFFEKRYNFLSGNIAGQESVAVNDIIISKSNPLSTCELELTINDSYAGRFICDGILVSTPFGSTAYNQSLHGPIVTPESPVYIITPINPINAKYQSLVVSDSSEIKVKLVDRGKDEKALIGFDGTQEVYELLGGKEIIITKSWEQFIFINTDSFDFFENLNKK